MIRNGTYFSLIYLFVKIKMQYSCFLWDQRRDTLPTELPMFQQHPFSESTIFSFTVPVHRRSPVPTPPLSSVCWRKPTWTWMLWIYTSTVHCGTLSAVRIRKLYNCYCSMGRGMWWITTTVQCSWLLARVSFCFICLGPDIEAVVYSSSYENFNSGCINPYSVNVDIWDCNYGWIENFV